MADSSKTPVAPELDRDMDIEGAGGEADLTEAEVRALAAKYPDDDPLAELARLVSEDNPFTRLDRFERPKVEPVVERTPFTAPPEEDLAVADDDVDVDAALKLYEQGQELVKQLEKILTEAENKVTELKPKRAS